MVGRVEGLFFFLSCCLEVGGELELVLGRAAAFGLQIAEFFGVSVALAAEAGFLNLQVAQFAFVGAVDGEFNQLLPHRLRFVEVGFAVEGAIACVDGHFEAGDSLQTPGDVGEGLGEQGFALAFGRDFVEEGLDVGLVAVGVIGGQQDGAAGERFFGGVLSSTLSISEG
jgi:hypothetical protein